MLSATDLAAYFARIRLPMPSSPTLDALHAITEAHAAAIPFENLDVLLGRPILLGVEQLVAKLVHEQRGGYCFEKNGLLLEVLTALGYRVTPLSARVRLQRARHETPPRTHLLVQVDLGEEGLWLTDVGVGALSLTAALRLVPGEIQTTPHETRRLTHEGDRWFHQALLGEVWTDVCEFTGEAMPLIDREVANWYTSAHPQSHFRNRLVVARSGPGGLRYSLLDWRLTVRGPGGVVLSQQLEGHDELADVLADTFGLRIPAGARLSWEAAAS